MADYVRIKTIIEASEASDYSNPYVKETMSYELTPDETKWEKIQINTGTAQTYDLSNFSTITSVIIHNTDATNFVTASWYRTLGSQAPGATGFGFVDGGGSADTITDLNAGSEALVTNGAASGLYVWPDDPEQTATKKTYGINSATEGTITCTSELALTAAEANAEDTAATLYFLDRARVQIAAGRILVIDSCTPQIGLQLAADTASVTLKILAVGT